MLPLLRLSMLSVKLILSLIKFGSYVLHTVFTPKFLIKISTILFMILLHGGDTSHLDETDSENEDEPAKKEAKGKGVDRETNEERANTTQNKVAAEENTSEDKTNEQGQAPPEMYRAGTVSETMLKIYEMMAKHENELLEAEKAEYKRTNELPEDNLHERISEFRKDDEEEMKIIRDNLEKARLDDSPEDVGSSANKRELPETEVVSDNKKIK